MKEQFIPKNFTDAHMAIIERANNILEEYDAQGLVLTLRQLYYQFVARGVIPNKQTEYKRLGSIINDARLAGLVDWAMMEDRVRSLESQPKWKSPANIVEAVAAQYREDLWADQEFRPEVWIEKDALAGVIDGVCSELRVDYFACRGYTSQSAQYEAGQRFRRYNDRDQTPVILHFGDHDPSGIDMTRDNKDRVSMFSLMKVRVERLALNMDQVRRYNPPPNPAKLTDSRVGNYIKNFGNKSWELDALEPTVISKLIRDAVLGLRHDGKWARAFERERKNKEALQTVSDRWDDVNEFVREN